MKEKICCIYVIEAIGGNPKKIGWKYVGQTIDFDGRKQRHWLDLRKNIHDSLKLQQYYNKYGKESLTHYLLKKCSKNELNFWEKWFVKSFDSYQNGFNCTRGGETSSLWNIKKCIMQNIYTNEVVEFDSIAEFSKKYNVSPCVVGAVILGKYNHAKQWFCPQNPWRPKFYQAISPIGKEVLIYQVSEFCRLHNFPSVSTFFDMLKGRVRSCHGWTTKNRKKINPREKDYLTFRVVSPTGEIFQEKNAQSFSKKFGLCNTWFNHLIHNRVKQHKGWTLYQESKENLCQVS